MKNIKFIKYYNIDNKVNKNNLLPMNMKFNLVIRINKIKIIKFILYYNKYNNVIDLNNWEGPVERGQRFKIVECGFASGTYNYSIPSNG